MESIYIVIVGVLFILAISDLVVGVSNDAVNFLNSAVGSKAASFKVIMFVAALGVVVGATFSTGMMEVARKGIFHPQMFYFSEIMVIFFAVMITDVILLDTFNTFGMPTSTTVSIVFELLGAAVAIALLKVMGDSGLSVSDYINSSKALAIISGILLSVVVAFLSGAIIQYISRLIFSFRFKKKMKLYGSIWGGLSIAAITYFILIKGLKGSPYASYEMADGVLLKEWVQVNAVLIIGFSFAAWTVLLQMITWLFKINISKVIVLVGTFALAMAFAGNDLVNFIGVPLAGYESYMQFAANPGADPNAFLMTGLGGKVETPFIFLILAGAVMVVTLYFNKKAKRVIKTSVDLSRQDEGTERFGSTMFSKVLVRSAIRVNKRVSSILPQRTNDFIRQQFDASRAEEVLEGEERPAFDMIRASVNLVVASILISFATSLKLPLSTTYVTFMVAMGTSLADNAWGRESAVYRITGVISVIMGWFFTAMAAFTVAFVVAFLSQLGGFIVIGLFILIAAYSVIRSHIKGKKSEDAQEEEKQVSELAESVSVSDIHLECKSSASDSFHLVADVFGGMVDGLASENRKELSHTFKKAKSYNKKVKRAKGDIKNVILRLDDDALNSAQYYTLVLDYMREIGRNLMFITEPSLEHVDNNHKPIGPKQTEDLSVLNKDIESFVNAAVQIITESSYQRLPDLLKQSEGILSNMDGYTMAQIKRLKKNKTGAKNTKLFLDVLAETKSLMVNMVNLTKSMRDLSKIGGMYYE
ncbi:MULTISPECIES: inorganic phosphate transporter [unclassified Lentimicrobium]|uniref:inorganic phosphate transporter n=1 Tax=unclassified Lentimicrobium TaxID=2677434 RepID=UPI0015520166|nr:MULTISPECIES: inorganic phosphate transporter [unclassified Lentimicrobium]NPD45933.1 inorganic phosphate transporter [Lentimicrobium sp. S6]NPD85942.1 inorganic phosphate transporter [Lentimicrobium sp. L6]